MQLLPGIAFVPQMSDYPISHRIITSRVALSHLASHRAVTPRIAKKRNATQDLSRQPPEINNFSEPIFSTTKGMSTYKSQNGYFGKDPDVVEVFSMQISTRSFHNIAASLGVCSLPVAVTDQIDHDLDHRDRSDRSRSR